MSTEDQPDPAANAAADAESYLGEEVAPGITQADMLAARIVSSFRRNTGDRGRRTPFEIITSLLTATRKQMQGEEHFLNVAVEQLRTMLERGERWEESAPSEETLEAFIRGYSPTEEGLNAAIAFRRASFEEKTGDGPKNRTADARAAKGHGNEPGRH